MQIKVAIDQSYPLKEIVSQDPQVIQRLRDLGIFEGTLIKVINIISFKSVYVLQFNGSMVALNKAEMSCLRF
ncbi:MAG: ferrous iron transport protein A [Moraxellaceae bacterium]|nr:ferrous iron transport protein A [Pseudobdellovibrionaceae bacterium]